MDTQELLDIIPAIPKVVLHDHLDGGLRPGTVVELASDVGFELPAEGADNIAKWFNDQTAKSTLEEYLETFAVTIGVMQTADAIKRVAREAVLDMAADGVVYAEFRWAPENHLERGLTLDDAVHAARDGFAEGVEQAAGKGHAIVVGQLLTAMRHTDRWMDIAELTVRHFNRGPLVQNPGAVVGFDLAGAEVGNPADRHPEVFAYLAENNIPATLHGGEAAGVGYMAKAVHVGRASRVGHGVEIVEDITWGDDDGAEGAVLGPFANWVRDHQLLLECCPTSNIMTEAGGATSYANHPITRLKELDFAVSVNTDNRLMARTSMTNEMRNLVREADWTLDDLADVTIAAAWSAFIHHDERRALIEDIIVPGFQRIEGAIL
jgi:adenosine deaminase